MPTHESRPTIHIPGTTSHTIAPRAGRDGHEGTLRYLKAGTGAPLVLLHTVRTQAEHFRHLIPLIADHYTVYALDLPGMGYSEIVPGASYDEPAMRAGVERLLTELDLHDVTLAGESMGAVLALTTAAELPERVRRVVAVNTYDFRGGIARSSLLARVVVSGVLMPGVGPVIAGVEPKPALRKILQGGLGDKSALRDDYVDELLQVGGRPGYRTVARAVYQALPSLVAARSRYPEVKAPVHLVYGEKDWSRPSDRQANKRLLPATDFTQVPKAGHFIALERPDVLADLLNAVAHAGGTLPADHVICRPGG
ncbi:alpha/beta fold hydrolase [Streptomyces sp. AC550_RSS872]|uniref:alpha/beta fold hydrolase n=1 Tax=Streptomyces sp. AC550_RSS872 TaxID=2823689 RepID=UPI001C264042|nr:alpha/beta hydrolase [Streptomyces sp. AC550_RSS872]